MFPGIAIVILNVIAVLVARIVVKASVMSMAFMVVEIVAGLVFWFSKKVLREETVTKK